MAFEGLSEKLQGALRKMTGRGRLTEQAVKEGCGDALIEALETFAAAQGDTPCCYLIKGSRGLHMEHADEALESLLRGGMSRA